MHADSLPALYRARGLPQVVKSPSRFSPPRVRVLRGAALSACGRRHTGDRITCVWQPSGEAEAD